MTSLLLLSLVWSSTLFASPPPATLEVGSTSLEIAGAIVRGATAEALVTYLPDTRLNPDPSVCIFPEDRYKPNKAAQYLTLAAEHAAGAYSLRIPLGGTRGSCSYALHRIDFVAKSETVYAPMTIQSPEYFRERDSWDPDSEPTPSFADAGTMVCEFSAPVIGLCFIDQGLPKMEYSLPFREHRVRFDIADSSKAPPRY